MADEFTIESRTVQAIRVRQLRHSHCYIFTVQRIRGRRLLWAGPVYGNAKAFGARVDVDGRRPRLRRARGQEGGDDRLNARDTRGAIEGEAKYDDGFLKAPRLWRGRNLCRHCSRTRSELDAPSALEGHYHLGRNRRHCSRGRYRLHPGKDIARKKPRALSRRGEV